MRLLRCASGGRRFSSPPAATDRGSVLRGMWEAHISRTARSRISRVVAPYLGRRWPTASPCFEAAVRAQECGDHARRGHARGAGTDAGIPGNETPPPWLWCIFGDKMSITVGVPARLPIKGGVCNKAAGREALSGITTGADNTAGRIPGARERGGQLWQHRFLLPPRCTSSPA